MAINIAGLISVILGACLICQPISYAVDKTIPDGHCGNLLAFEAYTAILTVILDVMVIVLPLPIVWKLQMRTKRKIELSIVFGMGLMCVSENPQNSTLLLLADCFQHRRAHVHKDLCHDLCRSSKFHQKGGLHRADHRARTNLRGHDCVPAFLAFGLQTDRSNISFSKRNEFSRIHHEEAP